MPSKPGCPSLGGGLRRCEPSFRPGRFFENEARWREYHLHPHDYRQRWGQLALDVGVADRPHRLAAKEAPSPNGGASPEVVGLTNSLPQSLSLQQSSEKR